MDFAFFSYMQYKKPIMSFVLKEQGPLALIKQDLLSYLKSFLPEEDIKLEQARNPDHGHLSLPVFILAKKQKISPQQLAQSLSEKNQ